MLLAGVPLNSPVAVLNVVQLGLLLMLNPNLSPLASAAVGAKTYKTPLLAVVAGVPLIVGAMFLDRKRG